MSTIRFKLGSLEKEPTNGYELIVSKLDSVLDLLNNESLDSNGCDCEYGDDLDRLIEEEYQVGNFGFEMALVALKDNKKLRRPHWQSGEFIEIQSIAINHESSQAIVRYEPSTRFHEVYSPSQDDLLATDWDLYE